VAFAAYMFVCSFYNVIVLEPMSVMGPARHASRTYSYFRAQLLVHIRLVGALSIMICTVALMVGRVAPHSPLVGAIVGSAVALPFLLLLWLARRMCYVLQRPAVAILGSFLYFSLVLGGLYVLRGTAILSPFSAFLLTGSASLLSAALVIKSLAAVRGDT